MRRNRKQRKMDVESQDGRKDEKEDFPETIQLIIEIKTQE